MAAALTSLLLTVVVLVVVVLALLPPVAPPAPSVPVLSVPILPIFPILPAHVREWLLQTGTRRGCTAHHVQPICGCAHPPEPNRAIARRRSHAHPVGAELNGIDRFRVTFQRVKGGTGRHIPQTHGLIVRPSTRCSPWQDPTNVLCQYSTLKWTIDIQRLPIGCREKWQSTSLLQYQMDFVAF